MRLQGFTSLVDFADLYSWEKAILIRIAILKVRSVVGILNVVYCIFCTYVSERLSSLELGLNTLSVSD